MQHCVANSEIAELLLFVWEISDMLRISRRYVWTVLFTAWCVFCSTCAMWWCS